MARCLLLEVWQRYNGQNNRGIAYSVREAARALGVGKNTPTKLFRELEDKGFLKARQRGSFHWEGGEATTWVLTTEPCGEKPATKEFMSWQPTGEKQKPVPHTGANGPPPPRGIETLKRAVIFTLTVPHRGTIRHVKGRRRSLL